MSDTLIRFIGRIKQRICKGQNGEFTAYNVLMNNPYPANKDGTPNQYHEGLLLWCDAKTGQKFLVKQMELAGVSEKQAQNGFINSIKINLGDKYHVDNLG